MAIELLVVDDVRKRSSRPPSITKSIEVARYAEAMIMTPVADAPSARTGGQPRQKWIVAACVLVYVVLSVAIYWPVSPISATRFPTFAFGNFGLGDNVNMSWSLAWTAHAMLHGLDPFHTTFLDYPGGAPITNGAPLLGLLASPVTLILGPVAAFNLLLRLAFASSTASMFLVLRNWCRWPVAFVGGLLYGFGPYMVTQGETHLQLMFLPIPPLIVWCLFDLLITKRHRPSRVGLALGALAGAQALIAPELLTLLSVVILIGLVVVAVHSRTTWRRRFDNLARAVVPAAIVFVAVTAYQLWSLLKGPGHIVGTVLPISELQSYRADLLGPIVPTFNQLLMPSSLAGTAAHFLAGNPTENSTYLGIPALGLMGYFGFKFKRDPVIAISTRLALAAFVLSLGSRLSIDGHVTHIPLPESLLAHVPVLDNLVPARFSFVVLLFAIISLAVGADRLIAIIAARKALRLRDRLNNATGIASLVACVALLLPQVPMTTVAPYWPLNINGVLKTIPTGSVVLTYPLTTYDYTEAMSWQAADEMKFKLIGGYMLVQGTADYGLPFQPLLSHPFVQEYLSNALAGRPRDYPGPNKKTSASRALCRFVSDYKVGAVIFWDVGAHPAKVRALFSEVFGAPVGSARRATILVWLTGSRSCAS